MPNPLTHDAIATLTDLRARAIAARDKAEQQLSDPDLPRGPLPVMARISDHEMKAAHLRIAIEALGGTVEDAEFEAVQRCVARRAA